MPAWLVGARTYIVALIGALVTVIYMLDWMRQDTWLGVMGLLTATGTATLRAGVAQVATRVNQVQTAVIVQAAGTDAKLSRVELAVAHVADQAPGMRPLRREP